MATAGRTRRVFGLSESIKRLAKKNVFPLRRLTPYATPGVLESEFVRWLKAQPLVGKPIRVKRPPMRKNKNRR
jgi:hypothetical protein